MTDQLYIGFTGHRNMICSDLSILEQIYYFYNDAIWVHGGAEGFDTQINDFTESKGKECKILKPDYKLYHDRPKFAPIARNYQIVEMSFFIIACWDYRLIGGTYRTLEYVKERKKIVQFVPYKMISTK